MNQKGITMATVVVMIIIMIIIITFELFFFSFISQNYYRGS